MKKIFSIFLLLISLSAFAQSGRPNFYYPICTFNLNNRALTATATPELMSLDSFLRNGGIIVRGTITTTPGDTCKNCVYLPMIYTSVAATASNTASVVTNTDGILTNTTNMNTTLGTILANNILSADNSNFIQTNTNALLTGDMVTYTLANTGTQMIASDMFLLGGHTNAAVPVKLTNADVTGTTSIEKAWIANVFPANTQISSLASLQTAHTVTCANVGGCVLYVVPFAH